MNKMTEAARLAWQEAYFARINWKHHLLDIAKMALADFERDLDRDHQDKPRSTIISEEVAKGLHDDAKKVIWGDSICVSFGARPVAGIPVVSVKRQSTIMSEDCASLVISQFISGSVFAMIYPPCSEVLKPSKKCYMVAVWRNPRTATTKQIRGLLDLTHKVDLFCGTATYGNNTGAKLMAKLQAKDEGLSGGKSKIGANLRYAYYVLSVALKLHGVPVPFGIP